MEADDGALRSGIHLRDTGLAAQPLDFHNVEQMSDLLGQLSESIDQLGGESIEVGARLKRRQAPVQTKSQL